MHSTFRSLPLLMLAVILNASAAFAEVSFEVADELFDCTESRPSSTVSTDLNGDGLQDLLIRYTDGSVAYVAHEGTGAQQPVFVLRDTQEYAGPLRVLHDYASNDEVYVAEQSTGGVALRFGSEFSVVIQNFATEYLQETVHAIGHYFADDAYSNIVTRDDEHVIHVWSYTGGSWQSTELSVWFDNNYYTGPTLGDLDQDGLDDLLLTNISHDQVHQDFYMVPGGSIELDTLHLISIPAEAFEEYNLKLSDLDGDGDQDIVYSCHAALARSGELGWLEQTEEQTFVYHDLLADRYADFGKGFLLADIDGNGLQDLVMCGRYGLVIVSYATHCFLQTEPGVFGPVQTLDRLRPMSMADIVELDDDPTTVQILGCQQAVHLFTIDDAGLHPQRSIGRSLGGMPRQLMELESAEGNQLLAITERGTGYSFFPDVVLDRPVPFYHLVNGSVYPELEYADLDGDGYVEPCIVGSSVRYLDPVEGEVEYGEYYAYTLAATLLDLNSDGVQDLIAMNADNQLRYYPSCGQEGHYFHSLSGLNEISLSSDDATGDGLEDLLVRSDNNQLLVFPSLGNGSFGPVESLDGVSHESKLQLADLNLDGRRDLVFLQEGTLCSRPRLESGWGEAVLYFEDLQINDFLAGDFGDGDEPELLVIAPHGVAAQIRALNLRTGQIFIGSAPVMGDLAAAHVDSDEDLDLLVYHDSGIDWLENTTTLGIDDATQPVTHHLLACYPNPFNPTTTIPFVIQQAAELRLAVYNLRGQEVAVLAMGEFAAGEHRVTFDGAALASGVYLIRLSGEGVEESRKALLLK